MRKGFTLIELMLVIAIIAIILALVAENAVGTHHRLSIGETVQIVATRQKVVIVRIDEIPHGSIFVCRIDNGPTAPVRYTEVHFFANEIAVLPDVER